jgi:outer membrane protein TolC
MASAGEEAGDGKVALPANVQSGSRSQIGRSFSRLAGLIPLVASAVLVAKVQSQEALPVPGSVSNQAPKPISTSPISNRNNIDALSVDWLVQEVLTRNPTLAQMTAAWEAAGARVPQVTSLDDPMFGATIAPASIGSGDVDFGYRLEISQKYPFPGKLCLRGQSALAEASAAGHELEDMRLQFIETTKNAFYDYFLTGRALVVNEEALRLLREFRDNARERYRLALVPQQDVLQAEVEIGRQQQRQLSLERLRRVATARINTLLRREPDLPLPPPPAAIDLDSPISGVSELRTLALSRRPDLQALADRIHAEQARLCLAQKEFYPDFEVMAAYDTIMGNGPTRDLAPQIGLRMNLPLRRDRRYAALAEARAKIAEKRSEYEKQVDQVNFQVQEAFEQVAESEKIIDLYRKTILAAAQGNVQAARAAYVTGKVTFLNLIESQRSAVELQDKYYEALADYFRRRATLERVIGGPITPAAPAASPVLRSPH